MVVEVRRSTAHPMSEAINLHDTIDHGNFERKESDPQAAAQDLPALARADSACVCEVPLRMPKDDMPVVVCNKKTGWGAT